MSIDLNNSIVTDLSACVRDSRASWIYSRNKKLRTNFYCRWRSTDR